MVAPVFFLKLKVNSEPSKSQHFHSTHHVPETALCALHAFNKLISSMW